MAAKPITETRRTPRRVFAHPIGVLVSGTYSVAQALQLSEGGMLFRYDKGLKTGAKLIVTLLLPSGGSVVARAEMIYERPGAVGGLTYGLRFVGLPLHLRRMIRNYVTAKTQAEAEKELGELESDLGEMT